MNRENHVWHFVLVRRGRPPATGERLGTLVLSPEHVARVGEGRIRAAVELERRKWARLAIANGFVDDHAVQVVTERGFRRSIFPAAALPGLSSPPKLVEVP